jgi:hypothetical protein
VGDVDIHVDQTVASYHGRFQWESRLVNDGMFPDDCVILYHMTTYCLPMSSIIRSNLCLIRDSAKVIFHSHFQCCLKFSVRYHLSHSYFFGVIIDDVSFAELL